MPVSASGFCRCVCIPPPQAALHVLHSLHSEPFEREWDVEFEDAATFGLLSTADRTECKQTSNNNKQNASFWARSRAKKEN